MKKTIDAEKTLAILASLWAEQNGKKIMDIKVTRRGSNEESFNSSNNSDNDY